MISVLLVSSDRNFFSDLTRIDGQTEFDVNVTRAGTGEQALVMIEGHPYALVVADERLPDMTGSEIVKKLGERLETLSYVREAGMKISWMVTGIRNDAYAQENPLVVEHGLPRDAAVPRLCDEGVGFVGPQHADQYGSGLEPRQRTVVRPRHAQEHVALRRYLLRRQKFHGFE